MVALVYVGSVAGGIGEVVAGRARPPPGVAIAGVAASVVAIFAASTLITVHARRIIRRCATDTLSGDARRGSTVENAFTLGLPQAAGQVLLHCQMYVKWCGAGGWIVRALMTARLQHLRMTRRAW